jgi:hypothetical protein
VARHHDHRRVGAVLQQACGRQAGEAGHRQIEGDDVGPDLAGQRQRGGAVCRFAHDLHVGLGVDQRAQTLAHQLMIVDDHDANHRRP